VVLNIFELGLSLLSSGAAIPVEVHIVGKRVPLCHSAAGSQLTSIRYGERLAEIGAVPSIGTVGDSFDNALAETVNGYYKSELIYEPRPNRP
jgi:transposase InsO family protein